MSYQPPACTGCGGAGGHAETTPKPDGGQTTVWRPCGTCGGRGRA